MVCADQDLLEPLKHLTTLTRMELSTEMIASDDELYLPPSLSSLVALKEVRLSQGWALGADDADSSSQVVQHWTNLESLDLRRVLGKVPAWIAELTSLRHLAFSNTAEGPATFLANATCLSALPLESIYIELDRRAEMWAGWGSFCNVLQAIPSLRAVELSNMDLSAARLAFSPQLTKLGLLDAQLQQVPAAVTSLPRLRHLDLCTNSFAGIPAGPYLETLQHLDLRCNSFLQHYPMQLLGAKELRRLLLPLRSENCRESEDEKQLRQHLEPRCTFEMVLYPDHDPEDLW